MILALLLAAGGACPLATSAPAPESCHYDLRDGPDLTCTPGETDTDDVKLLCETLTATRRCKPDKALRRALLAAYGVESAGEIDHLIPICLGGAQTVKNLWPQPAPQFKVKDKLEAKLCRDICTGAIDLQAARAMVRDSTQWTRLREPP